MWYFLKIFLLVFAGFLATFQIAGLIIHSQFMSVFGLTIVSLVCASWAAAVAFVATLLHKELI